MKYSKINFIKVLIILGLVSIFIWGMSVMTSEVARMERSDEWKNMGTYEKGMYYADHHEYRKMIALFKAEPFAVRVHYGYVLWGEWEEKNGTREKAERIYLEGIRAVEQYRTPEDGEEIDGYVSDLNFRIDVLHDPELLCRNGVERMRTALCENYWENRTKNFTSLADADIGDIVYVGKYEQDHDIDNGEEDIEWIVLQKEDDTVLLLSRLILDSKPYNDTLEDITWENSTLRKWLNGNFYNHAFSEDERARIMKTHLENVDSNYRDQENYYNIQGGNDTSDYVFILSEKAYMMTLAFGIPYYSGMNKGDFDNAWTVGSTEAIYRGLEVKEDGSSPWWLRDHGSGQSYCIIKNIDNGYTLDWEDISKHDAGVKVDCENIGVRPVMWYRVE